MNMSFFRATVQKVCSKRCKRNGINFWRNTTQRHAGVGGRYPGGVHKPNDDTLPDVSSHTPHDSALLTAKQEETTVLKHKHEAISYLYQPRETGNYRLSVKEKKIH